MCKLCCDAAMRHFPDCPKEFVGEFLLSATAFPSGCVDMVDRQLIEHKEAGCKTWEECCHRAERELDKQMTEYHNRNECEETRRL